MMSDKPIELIIDESVINSNDVFKIIEPLWWSVNIYDGDDQYYSNLSRFSKRQQQVFAIEWYLAEVNNGGHDQFYYNSTGIVWEEALNGFKEMELIEFFELIKESTIRLGGTPSKDRELRQEQLDKYKPYFGDLDEKLYEIEDKLQLHLMEYIKRNQTDFLFKGEIMVPKDFR
ncbi:DMP19 family protein [Paenibacillus cellulosilyticus]|uniref:DMP19 family protein n=1 Tax=Paenibacillus cellulosilyticus TaxID=375489 RepID=UPI0015809888|nr:DMP19 family protein [Paenibacillus cellulosilyticus]QKS44948.1 DMP19 family protein [Paenibacillus cellulosilyticus]